MKRNKFFGTLIGIIKVLVILFLCFMLVYLSIAVFNMKMDNKFVLMKGNYGKPPTWLDDWDNNDIDAIYDRMDTDGEFAVAYAMYLKACEKLMLAPVYGVRAVCNVGVTSGGLSIDVASNRTEQYRVEGTPVLNANQRVFSSYTNTIYVIDMNDPALAAILKAAIQFADRGYGVGGENYKQKGSLSVMDDEGEVITWSDSYEPEKKTAERVYADGDIKEKCNFVITPETMLPDSVEVKREYDEELQKYFYRIKMHLDCSDNSEGSATYYEAKAIRDLLGKNMKSLVYSRMEVEMTMYSNGYLINWNTVQEWTLKYELASFLSFVGTALNEKQEVFSYDPRECEVVDFTK